MHWFLTYMQMRELKSAALFNEVQHFLFVSHKICTTVPCDDDCAAGISHAGGFVPVPAVQISVNKASGEGIACSKHVINFNGKTRCIDAPAIREADGGTVCPTFDHKRLGTACQQVRN